MISCYRFITLVVNEGTRNPFEPFNTIKDLVYVYFLGEIVMKKIAGILITLFVISGVSFGQAYIAGMNYQMSVPLGDAKDFVGKTSFVGFGFEGRKFLKPNFSLGFSLQWNSFREEVRGKGFPAVPEPYGEAGIAVDHNREIKAYPILVTAHYYPGKSETFLPYVGVGLGTMRAHWSAETPLDTFTLDEWLLGLVPEIGFIAKVGEDIGFMANLKYNYGFKSGDMPAQSYMTLSVGFLWLHSK